MTIKGTAGDDTLNGTSGNDSFDMSQGGDDIVNGLGGNDIFKFGATLDQNDQVNGGSGTDTLGLDGDYSQSTLAPTINSVEKIVLSAGFNYELQISDSDVAAGKSLLLDASALNATDSTYLDASPDTDSYISILGGAGADTLYGSHYRSAINGGGGNDQITLVGGFNNAQGGDGDDSIHIKALIAGNSIIDGGTGSNGVVMDGDFSTGQVLGKYMGQNIGDFYFGDGHDYKIALRNEFVADGNTQYFYANSLSSTYSVDINASLSHHGSVYLQGGEGDDTLTGSSGNDGFEGRGGADKMTGGPGADTFYFDGVSDSTSSNFDRITDFNASVDRLSPALTASVAAIDPTVTTGALSASAFDSSLAAAVGSGQLQAHGAVLFAPTTGYLHGHTFLIIDDNGMAGYQAGADYVIDVTGITGTLTTSSII